MLFIEYFKNKTLKIKNLTAYYLIQLHPGTFKCFTKSFRRCPNCTMFASYMLLTNGGFSVQAYPGNQRFLSRAFA